MLGWIRRVVEKAQALRIQPMATKRGKFNGPEKVWRNPLSNM